jgi:hypothetical protein
VVTVGFLNTSIPARPDSEVTSGTHSDTLWHIFDQRLHRSPVASSSISTGESLKPTLWNTSASCGTVTNPRLSGLQDASITLWG